MPWTALAIFASGVVIGAVLAFAVLVVFVLETPDARREP